MFGGAVVASTACCRPVLLKIVGHFNGPRAARNEGDLPQTRNLGGLDGWITAGTHIPRPWFRRAAQLPPYLGLARQGTKGSLSVTESDPLIESSSLLPNSGPSCCDDDWEVRIVFIFSVGRV